MLLKNVVVMGSTGFIGQELIKKLVSDQGVTQILAIIRGQKPESSTLFNSPKIRWIKFDFENWGDLEIQISSFVGGAQASFFCCLGSTIKKARSQENFKKVDHDYVVQFAKLAKNCHADSLLIVSAMGAASNSKVFYNKVKGEMEESVQKEFSGRLHFLRPSLLLGDRNEFRFGERMAILLSPVYSSLMLGSLKKYRPVPASQVAQAMILLAKNKITGSVFFENEFILNL